MICLSFDTDHIDDERMREFLASFPVPGAGTFFCTHRYPAMPDHHELGAHCELQGTAWNTPLDTARETFPNAKGFRAHGCIWSHGLALELAQRGYTYISAHDQFGRPDVVPHREAWGLWHLPIFYMDTLDISFARHWPDSSHKPFSRELLETAGSGDGIYVFAFHPIHLLLNSGSPDTYLAGRDEFISGTPLERIRSEAYGAGDFYLDLIELMETNRLESFTLSDAVDRFSDLHSATA